MNIFSPRIKRSATAKMPFKQAFVFEDRNVLAVKSPLIRANTPSENALLTQKMFMEEHFSNK